MLSQDESYISSLSLTGLKVAIVVSNEDPKCQERLLIRVLGVHNLENKVIDNGIWANHCSPFRSASGDLPEPGEFVYVVFPNRFDPMSIIWMGFVRGSYQDGDNGALVVKQPHGEINSSGFSVAIKNIVSFLTNLVTTDKSSKTSTVLD